MHMLTEPRAIVFISVGGLENTLTRVAAIEKCEVIERLARKT